MLVALSAPVLHTCPKGTRPPMILRPCIRGEEYLMTIFLPPRVAEVSAGGLRTCAKTTQEKETARRAPCVIFDRPILHAILITRFLTQLLTRLLTRPRLIRLLFDHRWHAFGTACI